MAKLTLQDVFDMFEPFGIRSARVTAVLNACEDKEQAQEAFENLKLVVKRKYEQMRSGEVSAQRFQKIKPLYERLMNITLKNYNPPKKDSEIDAKVRKAAQIHDMLKRKDIAGISRLLGEDPVDAEDQQNIVNEILSRFGKRK